MFQIGTDSIGEPEVVDEIVRTLRAAGDAVGTSSEGVIAMFDDADSTTLFDYLAPGLIGLQQLRRTTEDLDDARSASVTYPVVSVQQLSDDVALSLAFSVIDVVLADGTRMRLNTRVTDVWRRFDGRWRAVHEHASVPIDIESERAVLDAPID